MARTQRGSPRIARVRHLARLAALAALGRGGDLEAGFRAAARAGVPLRALREAMLQVYLFAGFPRTVNALEALERALGRRRPGTPERIPRAEAARLFRVRGLALFCRVHGPDARRVLDDIGRRHPEFRDWIVVNAYGKVLGRKGLSAAERECLAVALLATLDLPRQQVAHVRGALLCGAGIPAIAAALDAVEGVASRGAVAFARGRLAAEARSPRVARTTRG